MKFYFLLSCNIYKVQPLKHVKKYIQYNIIINLNLSQKHRKRIHPYHKIDSAEQFCALL